MMTIKELQDMYADGYNTVSMSVWNVYLADNDQGWIEVPETFSSDGSGSDVTIANYRYFREKYNNSPDVRFISGSMSTQGVVYNSNTDNITLSEIVDSLTEYPVIDDELLAEVTLELIDEVWESVYSHDFKNGLIERFEVWDIEISDENLMSEFDTVREELNEEWVNYQNSMQIDIQAIIDAVNRNQFLATYVTEVNI